MKRWTVMLVPRQEGASHRLNINTVHLWVVAVLVAGLVAFSFSMVDRHRAAVREAEDLRQTAFSLNDLYQNQLQREVELRKLYQGNAAAVQQALDHLFQAEMQKRGLAKSLVPAAPAESKPRGFWRSGIVKLLTVCFADPESDVGEEELDGQGGGSIGLGEAILDLILDPFREPTEEADKQTQSENQALETYQGRLDRITRRIDQLTRLPSLVPTSADRWRITSGFGIRREPFGKQIGYHHGVDVAARRGSEVRATAGGTVVYAKELKTLGQSVRIDHGNGLNTLYGHLMSTDVEAGDRVERGQVIGRLGNTGHSSGPHVHYEVRLNNRPINPESFLDGLHPEEIPVWPED